MAVAGERRAGCAGARSAFTLQTSGCLEHGVAVTVLRCNHCRSSSVALLAAATATAAAAASSACSSGASAEQAAFPVAPELLAAG